MVAPDNSLIGKNRIGNEAEGNISTDWRRAWDRNGNKKAVD